MFSKILALFKKPQIEAQPAPHPLDGPTKRAVQEEVPLVKLEQYQPEPVVTVVEEPVIIAKAEVVPEELPKKKPQRKRNSPSQKSGQNKKRKSKNPSTKA